MNVAPTAHGSTYLNPRLSTWRRWTDVPLIALALGSLPILLLDFVSDRLGASDRRFIYLVNLIVFLAFVADYVVEFTLAAKRGLYVRQEWRSLLIAISQGLALLPALGVLGVARAARAVRPVIFAARLLGIAVAEASEMRRVFRKHAVSVAVSISGLVWITSAVAFTLVEDVGTGRRVKSFGDALWWSAATISTVGYGDIYPVTVIGRFVAVLTMIVGVSTFGVLTAKIASLLIRSESK
jgi:voltage-gated potassium channel